jgi:hypothetical protein
MIKPILCAAAVSLITCSVAWASPVQHGSQLKNHSDAVTIKKGDDDRDRDRMKHRWRDHHAYDDDDWDDRPDYRYRGWRHYSYRPDDWDDRGCVAVGPLWYCP